MGVSARKVDALVQAFGMSGISKSQVPKLRGELDDRMKDFLNRELTGAWPYVWLDATYLKSRHNGHVVPRALVVAVGDGGVLERVPAWSGETGPCRREVDRLQCTRGAEERGS